MYFIPLKSSVTFWELLLKGAATLPLAPRAVAVTEVQLWWACRVAALPWFLGAASHLGGFGLVLHVYLQNSRQFRRHKHLRNLNIKLKTPCSSVCSVEAVEEWAVSSSCF